MTLFLRILLFTLYITPAFAVPASDPVPVEILERQYVQFELNDNTPTNISIMRSFELLVRVIKSKSYSLLNWSSRSRSGSLEIANYDRTGQFGRWANDRDDDTCFNTRAKVLIRDSDRGVVLKEDNHCAVESGHWNDPYTGDVFTSPADIQIDHVVPLKNAYLSGAYRWNFKSRCLYANYLGEDFHLMSVNSTQNMKKGDRSPDKYMPPNAKFTCTYLKNWLSIKFLWGLRMTITEAQAITQLIKDNHCNLNRYRISSAEIMKQSRFVQEKMELCASIDPTNQELPN